ncbi:hypothetical protein HGB47_14880 [Leptospira yasudae]|uniref:hypothetical protein n=1 Tax=Leptospira yasudae TaxID=2202201 RepID=UPI001C4F323C|nr:hypothetical protein [Leptospira yasudae]MBW0434901.1 hypothetical protein [Leptospira yasudae]
MFKVTKEEILEKLVLASMDPAKRNEITEWAKQIAKQFTMNLVNLNDRVLEEAFKTLQIGMVKMNELGAGYFKEDNTYFIRKEDYDYWIEILKSNEILNIKITEDLKIADPREDFSIAENADCQINLSSSEFTSITGIKERRSFDDLYYNSYVRFWLKNEYKFYIHWDMNIGYKTGTVYSNLTNPTDAIQKVKQITNRSDLVIWKNDFKRDANSD